MNHFFSLILLLISSCRCMQDTNTPKKQFNLMATSIYRHLQSVPIFPDSSIATEWETAVKETANILDNLLSSSSTNKDFEESLSKLCLNELEKIPKSTGLSYLTKGNKISETLPPAQELDSVLNMMRIRAMMKGTVKGIYEMLVPTAITMKDVVQTLVRIERKYPIHRRSRHQPGQTQVVNSLDKLTFGTPVSSH